MIEMVNDQVSEFEKCGEFSLLQSISVAQLDNTIYVLDGQHRIRAFERLKEMGLPVENIHVPVVIYIVSEMTEMIDRFSRINKHLPVHPLDVREAFDSNANGGFVKPFVEWMESAYGSYMKKNSTSVRCPHVSIDGLKNAILSRGKLNVDFHMLRSSVEEFNDHLSTIRDEIVTHGGSDALRKKFQECEKKVQKLTIHPRPPVCFLGMFKNHEWLDMCLHYATHNSCNGHNDIPMDQEGMCKQDSTRLVPKSACWALLLHCTVGTSSSNRRQSIPMAVRRAVWGKWNHHDSNTGSCYVCDADLKFTDMECGHVVAHVLGGKSDIDNLMPICRVCNRDMGIQNLEAYRSQIKEAMGIESSTMNID